MKTIYKRSKNSTAVLLFAALICFTNTKAQQIVVQTFSYTGAITDFTVPSCVSTISMQAWGGQGGSLSGQSYPGGLGAMMSGVFSVTPGQVIRVLVGGQGVDINTGASAASGGGGGSFVALLNGTNTPIPWLVAGGGGGRRNSVAGAVANTNGVITTNGQASYDNTGAAGTNGNGGLSGEPNGTGTGGPGGGFYTNGGPSGISVPGTPGYAFVNGGLIAPTCSPFTSGSSSNGAFGGGGAGCWCYRGTPGGGGGYSGGGAGVNDTGGGGGGSYNGGTNQSNAGGVRAGNGQVIFTYGFNGNGVAASITPTAICLGNSASLTASGMLSYTWSTGANTSSIVVTPTSNTSYTVQGTNSVNCVSSSVLNVTVSSGLPVLSVNTSTNVTCLGKTVTLTANGALTYSWSGGVTNGLTYSPTITQAYTVTGFNGCGTSTAVTSITVAPLPISAVVSPTLTCANKPSVLTAVGPATLFTWTPFQAVLQNTQVTVNPSVTTIWTVTASDGTCVGTATVLQTVNPNPTLNVTASASMVCEGYPVIMNASGGINYSWTPGNLSGQTVTVNPGAPTLYSVSASNSLGCIAGTTQIVLTSPSPTVTLVSTNTLICLGSGVNMSASGADTYSWSNGSQNNTISITPTVTTTYTVVGTSTANSCSATKGTTVVVFSPGLSVTGASTICNGTSTSLTASGADSYLWDNGSNANLIVVSPSVSTGYTVTATSVTLNLTCSVSKTFGVAVNPKPPVTAASTKTTICRYESTTLNAGGAGSYTWSVPSGGAASSVSGPTITVNPTITVLYTYSVTGTDANGCTNVATTQLRVSACLGLNSNSGSNAQLLIYPNPSNGEFVIEYDSEITLNITNELGQVVKTLQLNDGNKYKAQVNNLAGGVYFINALSGSQKINEKLIINR